MMWKLGFEEWNNLMTCITLGQGPQGAAPVTIRKL